MANSHPETEYFEPKVAGFFCHTCCGDGSGQGQVDREKLPENLKSLKYVCASMVDARLIREAVEDEVDGVLICGCLVGRCLNCSDNAGVLKSIHHMTMALPELGLSPDRIHREWVCIPGGETYEGVLAEFVEHLRELGPRVPDPGAAVTQQV